MSQYWLQTDQSFIDMSEIVSLNFSSIRESEDEKGNVTFVWVLEALLSSGAWQDIDTYDSFEEAKFAAEVMMRLWDKKSVHIWKLVEMEKERIELKGQVDGK